MTTRSFDFESDPPTFLKVPFGSCALEPTLERFRATGFENVEGHAVEAVVVAEVDLSHYDGLLSAPLSGDGSPGAIVPAEVRP